MRRVLVFLLVMLIACRALAPLPPASPISSPVNPSPPATLTSAHTAPPLSTPSLELSTPSTAPSTATLTPVLIVSPSLAPLPETSTPDEVLPSSTPVPLSAGSFTVRLHPDGGLYVGDLVSLEVIAPAQADLKGHHVQVRVDNSQSTPQLQADFGSFGIGNRSQATFLWAWNTSTLPAGDHQLTFSIQPDGLAWTETVSLLTQNQAPPPEPQAAWARAESDCCLVYSITGTAAGRDLPALLEMADEQAQKAARSLNIQLKEPIPIDFLGRVLGHGGFTSQEIAISYLDRNYAGGVTKTVLNHEIVHLLDSRLGGELRPTLLVEGLAVYLSGGHYKPEPLMARAAALLPPTAGCTPAVDALQESLSRVAVCGLDWYLPLGPLIDNFYLSQHEIGYIEAGALVEFIVERWGWQAFSDFYRDIHPQPPEASQEVNNQQSRAMQAALEAHFGITLAQLEERFLDNLRQQALTPENSEDTRLTVELYNTVRRYQQLLDPSAYFLTAWLPDSAQMRQRHIVADYLRHPMQPENLALETMLVAADADLLGGDYAGVEQLITAANAVLEVVENGGAAPFAAYPLAGDYYALVQAVLSAGYQPQKIQLEGNQARVWASASGPGIVQLNFLRYQNGWVAASANLFEAARFMGIQTPVRP
jgi:hypothetical protein